MIRIARHDDLEQITSIYNEAIRAKFQTAFTKPFITEEREGWLASHCNEQYPLFVYEDAGRVVGYLTISPYREGRAALDKAVEISYFIAGGNQGKGIGTQLLKHCIDACRELGYKTILAIVLEPNIASIKLLEKLGFQRWGYLPLIADFDGVECSQVYYGFKP